MTSLSIERFRYLLIRWIVLCHLALSIIEHEAFRTLVKYISPAIEHYLVKSGDTIRQWIIDEFGKQQKEVKAKLKQAKSKIHISFDLWTSPNSLAMCAVVAHFLDEGLRNKSCLIGMRRVKGSHSGENIFGGFYN